MLAQLAQATYDYTYTNVNTTDTAGAAGLALFSGFFLVIWLVVLAVMIVSMWKLFEKAGQAGWKSIIPIYNYWVLCEISGYPGWLALVFLIAWIPFVGGIAALIVSVIVNIGLAKSFGKEPIWAVLLILLPIIGYPMLAFDKNIKYVGPGGKGGSSAKPAAPATPAA
jgi:hypothetical protein